MKKTLAYLLTVTIVAATFIFVGCGKDVNDTSTEATKPTSQAATATQAATESATTVAPTETPEKAAVEKNGLKVDKNGDVTDKNGKKLKADADGKITVKNDDGTTVTIDKETIKSVNNATANKNNQGNNSNTSSKNTTSKPGSNNTSSKSSNTSSRSQSSGTTSSKPNKPAASDTTSNVSPGNKKTWHEAVYKIVTHPAETKQVWVVDQEAYSYEEPVYEYQGRTICNTCGADITDTLISHGKTHARNLENFSYHDEWVQVQVGTKTVDVPEKGHYETKVIKEEWTEQVLVKEAGYY